MLGLRAPLLADKPKNQEVSVKRKWTRPRCCFSTPACVWGFLHLPPRQRACFLWEEGRGGTPLEKGRGGFFSQHDGVCDDGGLKAAHRHNYDKGLVT